MDSRTTALATSRFGALVLCYYYYPSPEVASRRLSSMTRCLRGLGADVSVISLFGGASPDSLPDGGIPVPVTEPSSVTLRAMVATKRWLRRFLHRPIQQQPPPYGNTTPSTNAGQDGTLGRLSSAVLSILGLIDPHKRWSWRAMRASFAVAAGKDLRVIVTSGPHFTPTLAAAFVAWRLRKPLIIDFRDPLFAGGEQVLRMSRPSYWLCARLEARLITFAAAVTCASPGIASALVKRYPQHYAKIHQVLNGFDGVPAPRLSESGGRMNLLFAGCLYVNRDPMPLLRALEYLVTTPGIDRKQISMTFVGECETFRDMPLREWLRGRAVEECVRIIPEVPFEDLQPLLSRATVLVNLAQEQPRQIPAKTFEHLASGREILVFCEPDSDTASILEGLSGVSQIGPGEDAKLNDVLAAIYRRQVNEGGITPPSVIEVIPFARERQNEVFTAIAKPLMGCV